MVLQVFGWNWNGRRAFVSSRFLRPSDESTSSSPAAFSTNAVVIYIIMKGPLACHVVGVQWDLLAVSMVGDGMLERKYRCH